MNRLEVTTAAGQALSRPERAQRAPAGKFAAVLEQARKRSGQVQFSAHARKRLADHGLQVDATVQQQLNRALEMARAKGIRQTLVVTAGANWVLSVPQQTVITVVPQEQPATGVFTNIDGAVLLG